MYMYDTDWVSAGDMFILGNIKKVSKPKQEQRLQPIDWPNRQRDHPTEEEEEGEEGGGGEDKDNNNKNSNIN